MKHSTPSLFQRKISHGLMGDMLVQTEPMVEQILDNRTFPHDIWDEKTECYLIIPTKAAHPDAASPFA